jgi:citronellol/citronellal dehydrogenase
MTAARSALAGRTIVMSCGRRGIGLAILVAAGGKAVAVVGHVRHEADAIRAAEAAAGTFGGIGICVNNASAMFQVGTELLSLKQFDLIQASLPHLRVSDHARVLTISPPLNLAPHWLRRFPAYTQTKCAMTPLTLGWAAECADAGIAANCLWPQTRIATAAVANLLGGAEAMAISRSRGSWRMPRCTSWRVRPRPAPPRR